MASESEPEAEDNPRQEALPEASESKDHQHLEQVYSELRRRAYEALRSLPPGQTMQPTGLVHEAWANMVTRGAGPFRDQTHFLSVATLAIKNAMIDRLRAKGGIKRGAEHSRVVLDDDFPIQMPQVDDETTLQVDELLEELRRRDSRAADVVVYRFFMGMTEAEAAAAMGVAPRTVRRDWTFARTWLVSRLGDPLS